MAVFDAPEAIALNRARLAHIESLHLDIRGRSVLDVGAGLGYLAQFFAERVVCTEGREENV